MKKINPWNIFILTVRDDNTPEASEVIYETGRRQLEKMITYFLSLVILLPASWQT